MYRGLETYIFIWLSNIGEMNITTIEYHNNNCCDIHFTYTLLHMANLLNVFGCRVEVFIMIHRQFFQRILQFYIICNSTEDFQI